jgi:hypothetical protein
MPFVSCTKYGIPEYIRMFEWGWMVYYWPILKRCLILTQPSTSPKLFPNLRFCALKLSFVHIRMCRSQWPRGLMRRSAAARLLRSWVRIPPRAWMFVWCECCVLSGRGLCDELTTRPEESYRLWCVVVCDLEKPQELGGHDPGWVAAPQQKSYVPCELHVRTIPLSLINRSLNISSEMLVDEALHSAVFCRSIYV